MTVKYQWMSFTECSIKVENSQRMMKRVILRNYCYQSRSIGRCVGEPARWDQGRHRRRAGECTNRPVRSRGWTRHLHCAAKPSCWSSRRCCSQATTWPLLPHLLNTNWNQTGFITWAVYFFLYNPRWRLELIFIIVMTQQVWNQSCVEALIA